MFGTFSVVYDGVAATPSCCADAHTANFISVADIHFDPFYTCDSRAKACPLINKLQMAPAEQWSTILNAYDTRSPRYLEDTNAVLFKSTLKQFKKTAAEQHPQFVLVLGDFLSHDYKKNYQLYSGDHSIAGTQRFIDKTLQFIAAQLAIAFSTIDIYMVVGNNDGYGEHYTSQAIFYKNVAPIWSTLIRDKYNRGSMQKEFAQAGYYAVDIQKGLRLIVLNTAYFSSRGTGMDREAQNELNWLRKQLELLNTTQRKALIALHIPSIPQISISQNIPVAALGLWQPRYIEQFLLLLKGSAAHIMAVLPAHLHVDWAQRLQFKDVANPILLSATPSISPVVGNNPGYKVYSYDPEDLVITNYLTYFYPLDKRKWKLEYDFMQTYQPNCPVGTVVQSLKQLTKNLFYLQQYKQFFPVSRVAPIFSDLTYPAIVCDLKAANYSEYQRCAEKY
jgi:hypothetical protein